MLRAILVIVALGCPVSLWAQRVEIYPQVGGFLPSRLGGVVEIRKEGIYGVNAGVFITRKIEAEAHFGYINHLNFAGFLSDQRAYVWSGLGGYHLGPLYASAGLGGVTTSLTDDGSPYPERRQRQTFLAVSYGGGVKALRKWGPIGYRVDLRGRTLPHYYGFRFSWLEATTGVTFSF